MAKFPQRRSRVFFLFLTHVVLALCLISTLLSFQVHAQEGHDNNVPQAVVNGSAINVQKNTSGPEKIPITVGVPPVVKKTPPPKRPAQASPKIHEGPSTIQWRARVLEEGCAQTVTNYLKRIHEGRKDVKFAVSQARDALNAAHMHNPQNVQAAEHHLKMTKQALSAFDAETLKLYGGNLPKTCVTEAKKRMKLSPKDLETNNIYGGALLLYYTFASHAQTFYLTLKGVWNYMVESYVPVVKDFQSFSDVYYKKAVRLYNEAHPKPGLFSKIVGFHKTVPTSEFIMKIMEGLAYSCVPLMLMLFMALLAVLLYPVLLFGVLIPDFIYHVWIRLFIFYYPYAMVFPGDFITNLQSFYGFVLNKNWGGCTDLMQKAVVGAITDFNQVYYNTVIMGQMVWLICFVSTVMVWRWLFFFVIRRKKTKRNLSSGEKSHPKKGKSSPREKSKKQ